VNDIKQPEVVRGKIDALDDKRAVDCLSLVLSSEIEDKHAIYRNPEDAIDMLMHILDSRDTLIRPLKDGDLPNLPNSARTLLITMAEDANLRDRVEKALKLSARDYLLEPVSTILIVSGALMILKTKFNVNFKRSPTGEWMFEGDATSPPLSEKLLQKLVGIFSA
jgi:hypothetical protein